MGFGKSASMTNHPTKPYEKELFRLNHAITVMGELTGEQLATVIAAAERSDARFAASVIERDPEADRMAQEVHNLAVRILALRHPIAIDLRQVMSALKIAGELERICDYAKDLALRLIALRTAQIEPLHSLLDLARSAATMVDDTMQAYTQMDVAEARAVWNRDAELDARYTAVFRELLLHMLEDPRRISAGTQMLFMARAVERIGDRATNIAEIVMYLVGGTAIEDERPKADATKSMMLSRPAA